MVSMNWAWATGPRTVTIGSPGKVGVPRGRFRGGVVQHCSMTVAVVESQGYALALGGTAVQIPAAGADYGHGQQGRAIGPVQQIGFHGGIAVQSQNIGFHYQTSFPSSYRGLLCFHDSTAGPDLDSRGKRRFSGFGTSPKRTAPACAFSTKKKPQGLFRPAASRCKGVKRNPGHTGADSALPANLQPGEPNICPRHSGWCCRS